MGSPCTRKWETPIPKKAKKKKEGIELRGQRLSKGTHKEKKKGKPNLTSPAPNPERKKRELKIVHSKMTRNLSTKIGQREGGSWKRKGREIDQLGRGGRGNLPPT